MILITNLSVSLDAKKIINDFNLQITPGTVHVIMGRNGSGKSTLAAAIMGNAAYAVEGSILFNEQELLGLGIDQRAKRGIFLAYQHPCTIAGVTIKRLLHESYRALHGTRDSLADIDRAIALASALLAIDPTWLDRCVHDGFSGGEKKRIELLQLMVLRPSLAILDEIDSGLDIDALKIVCDGIAAARRENPAMSLLLITHYPRMLTYLTPDYVHVISDGQFVASGDAALAVKLEKEGYGALL